MILLIFLVAEELVKARTVQTNIAATIGRHLSAIWLLAPTYVIVQVSFLWEKNYVKTGYRYTP